MLALATIHVHASFKMPIFTRFTDMIEALKFKNGSRDFDHTRWFFEDCSFSHSANMKERLKRKKFGMICGG